MLIKKIKRNAFETLYDEEVRENKLPAHSSFTSKVIFGYSLSEVVYMHGGQSPKVHRNLRTEMSIAVMLAMIL